MTGCRHRIGDRRCGLKVYRKKLCSLHYWAQAPGRSERGEAAA